MIKMTEEEMRPGKYINEKQDVHKKCTEELLKREQSFVSVSCPACDTGVCTIIFEKGGFKFVKCSKCETIYVNPRPTFQMLMEYQVSAREASRIWVEKIYPLSEDVRREHIFKPRAIKVVELAEKYSCKTNKIVDVGAGFGTFGEEIVKLKVFVEVIAVESGSLCAANCRRKGLTVIEKPIEDVELKNVDMLTNFELIEHLFNPKEFILSCKIKLSKNGLLIFSTPNSKGFEMSTLGMLSGSYQAPLHLNYFHPDSVSLLLESCGFEIVEILTPGILDAELVRKKILNNEFNVDNNPFLKNILIEKWDTLGGRFQKFIADNNLSSHMWAVARNVD